MTKIFGGIFLILVFSSFTVYQYAIKLGMTEPPGWFSNLGENKPGAVLAFTIQQTELDQFLRSTAMEQQLYEMYKYGADKVHKEKPTIKAYMIKSNYRRQTHSVLYTTDYIAYVRTLATELTIIDSPRYITIDGRKAIYSFIEYKVDVKNHGGITVRNKTLEIPLGKLSFFATFMDNRKDDCSQLYDRMIYTIKLDGKYIAEKK